MGQPPQRKLRVGKNQLTIKQKKFVDAYVANGGNGTQALIAASPVPISYATARSESSRLTANPNVRAEVVETLALAGVSPGLLAHQLLDKVVHTDPRVSLDAVKFGYQLLGGMPQSTSVTVHAKMDKMSPGELRLARFVLREGRQPTDAERDAILAGTALPVPEGDK